MKGRGLPFLNRVLASTSRKPLEHYQALWQSFAVAALLTLALHGALVTRHQEAVSASVGGGWDWR